MYIYFNIVYTGYIVLYSEGFWSNLNNLNKYVIGENIKINEVIAFYSNSGDCTQKIIITNCNNQVEPYKYINIYIIFRNVFINVKIQ